MTKLLDKAIEEASQRLSAEEQDELARTILEIVNSKDDGVYVLSDEEDAAIDEGLAYAERGEFASDDEVRAIFSKYKS